MEPPPVIDLAVVGAACRPVVQWYDDLQAGRSPTLRALDDAVGGLRALAPVGGRLGRAIALVVAGGADALDDTVAALAVLRQAADHAPASAGEPRLRRARLRYDVPLPGLDTDASR